MAFKVSGEALSSKYLKESDLIDDYIGNTLWGWGTNTNGQLGLGDTINRSSPTQILSGTSSWIMVTAQYNGTFFIDNQQCQRKRRIPHGKSLGVHFEGMHGVRWISKKIFAAESLRKKTIRSIPLVASCQRSSKRFQTDIIPGHFLY